MEVRDPERRVERAPPAPTGVDAAPAPTGFIRSSTRADDGVERRPGRGRAGDRRAGRERRAGAAGHAPNARPRVGRIRSGTL